MKALFCEQPHQLRWRDVPDLTLTDSRQALVQPLVVATCDIDAPMIAGETPYRGPIALGHECLAEVVEVGSAVQRVQRGDRVVVPFQISCGACDACQRGHTGNCTAVTPRSMYGFGGGGGGFGGAFADRLLVPFADAMLERVPTGLDLTHLGSLADNLPDAYRAVAEPLARQPGAAVLVVGGGCVSIGLYAVMLARALGAGSVVYLDVDAARGARATQLGADVTLLASYPESAAARFPITVDASADPRGLACALRSTAPDGTCTSTGGYFTDTTPIPLRDLYLSCGTLVTGRCHARPALAPLLQLAAAGQLQPELVTAQVSPLEDAAEILAEGRRDKLVFVRAGALAAPVLAMLAAILPGTARADAGAPKAAHATEPAERWERAIDVQVDPTPFLLRGFAPEVGVSLGRHRVLATVVAYDVPHVIAEDKRFDERRQVILGAGYQYSFLGHGHGPFLGVTAIYTRSRFTLRSTDDSTHTDTFKTTFRLGWTVHPFAQVPALFLAPWIGPSVSYAPDEFSLDGVRIERRRVGVLGAIQVGWAFAL